MRELDQARIAVRDALHGAVSPAVLCSFGKDSLLLLALVREIRSVPVLWFKAAANDEQVQAARALIREWHLDVYSYQPADVYLLTNNGDTALIQEYAFGSDRLPLAVDMAPSESCSLTAFPARTEALFLPFDVLLVGYKDSDSHWLKGGTHLFDDDYTLGNAKVRAPIRHLTDEQVRNAVHALNIPYKELDDSIKLCTACMTQDSDEVWCPAQKRYIPRAEWAREEALTAFRQRFNLNGGPH